MFMPLKLHIETTVRIAIGDPSNPTGPDGLYDEDNGVPINDATVELLSITDEATGLAVAGVTLPITLVYLAASNGVYKAKIPATAAFVEGRSYDFKVRALAPGGDQLMLYGSVFATKA